MESIATEAGIVSGLVESITTAMNKTEDPAVAKAAACGDNFVEYQTRMVTAAKEIARLAQDMVIMCHISFFFCSIMFVISFKFHTYFLGIDIRSVILVIIFS